MDSYTLDMLPKFYKIGKYYLDIIEGVTILFGQDALRLAHVKPATKIIDIACGTGGLAIKAADLGLDVVATDFSQCMLDILNTRNPLIKTLKADGQTLEGIESDQFDYASSIFGIFVFPDRMAGWKSAFRVLKKGGVFVTSVWDASSGEDMIYKMNSVAKFLPEDKQPLAYQNGADFRESIPVFKLADKNLLKSELEQSGFREVQIFTLTHSVVYYNRDELFDSFLKIQEKVREGYDSLSEEEQGQCRHKYFKAVGYENYMGPSVLPAIAHIAVAIK